MIKNLSNPSLSNKKIRQQSFRRDAANYEEFLELLYCDIDRTINRLSQSKDKYYQGLQNNPDQGENLINCYICDMLDARGWIAVHDQHVNGNADIVVSIEYEDYQWIGEGKIRAGNTNLDKGIKQLIHRYSTGRDSQTAGGLILYINGTSKSAKALLDNWKSYLLEPIEEIHPADRNLPSTLSPAIRVSQCPDKELIFYSYHMHPSSGLEYVVRHMIIDFRQQPIDQLKS